MVPEFLTHYYEASIGPFVSLSDLSDEDAEEVLEMLREEAKVFASRRPEEYLESRWGIETLLRHLFMQKGGQPRRAHPHYMVLGECPWLKSWYPKGRELQIPLSYFSREVISFTYGDTFPAMRTKDGKPYRGRIYMLDELPALIEEFGLPQDWNADGQFGPERYIEAHIWDNAPIVRFMTESQHIVF